MNESSHEIRQLQRAFEKAKSPQTKVIDTPLANLHPLRRASRPIDPTRLTKACFQLVEEDGVLEWEDISGAVPSFRQKRSGGRATIADQALLTIEFKKLPPSEVTAFLAKRDQSLTPASGLRRWNGTELVDEPLPKRVGNDTPRILLIVHGTFSNGDNFMQSFVDRESGTDPGREFIRDAMTHYQGNIFTFDHPTLSVSPICNAIDLHRALQGFDGEIDIITHSRGGLVTRWWMELFDHQQRCKRAILVGSPLNGTSLASPHNIRNTIKKLTYLGKALTTTAGLAGHAVPVFKVVEALLHVLTSVTTWTANTPIADAAMAMVPGLFGQSKVGNNPELLRLMSTAPIDPNRYYAIVSDFCPDNPKWAFWRYFRKGVIANFAADALFEGKNDLVVDTDSMTRLTDGHIIKPGPNLLDVSDLKTIHHINYFSEKRVIEFVRNALQVPGLSVVP